MQKAAFCAEARFWEIRKAKQNAATMAARKSAAEKAPPPAALAPPPAALAPPPVELTAEEMQLASDSGLRLGLVRAWQERRPT